MKQPNILQIPNFLTKEERDILFNTVCKHQKVFNPIGIPQPNGEGSFHLSLESEEIQSSEVEFIRDACKSLSNRIMKLLPHWFVSLGIKPFPVSHIPLSIVNGLNGHTGSVHTDESGGRSKISLLYYFHKTPKAFQGGALELFETDETSQNEYHEKAFAKIEHEDNLLIAFPSKTYHGVTDVEMDSTEFEDGRFVIVGFLGPV